MLFISYLYCNLVVNQTQQGDMSLHVAADNGHRAVAQLLIESQAKPDIKNNVSVELLVACMGMGSYIVDMSLAQSFRH